MAPLDRALVFIGFMGAGKSTVAAEVAAVLGSKPLDVDQLLEERFGHSVAREFELHGEESFRAHERELVCGLLARAQSGAVVALGGGAVLSEEIRAALAAHLVVLLDVTAALAWERVQADLRDAAADARRPLARDPDDFRALHAVRQPLYEELADAILPAGVPGVARRALPALGVLGAVKDWGGDRDLRRRPRLLWATAASGEYPVLVAPGLLRSDAPPAAWRLGGGEEVDEDVFASEVCARAYARAHTRTHTAAEKTTTHAAGGADFSTPAAGRDFCVTDDTVAALYAPPLRATRPPIAIPPGEAHKTLAVAERVWRELAAAGMTRADRIVALGGGVVGDLAGFCAAAYQRGVPVVQAPTTLVAQVDSAYGGKTGVDLPEAKNYVGAYHQPVAVLVDPDALRTLPVAELHAGWVEVLKTALIAGGGLWKRVAAEAPGDADGTDGSPMDPRTIVDCARLKLTVVAEDERDGGRRQVLNLGHTVGHAIETVTGYARYRHGEAVGLGLLAALRLSGQDDLRAQVHALLDARGLPVTLHGAGVPAVLDALAHDKKRLGEHVPFVLLDAPGEVNVGCRIEPAALRAAVEELTVA